MEFELKLIDVDAAVITLTGVVRRGENLGGLEVVGVNTHEGVVGVD